MNLFCLAGVRVAFSAQLFIYFFVHCFIDVALITKRESRTRQPPGPLSLCTHNPPGSERARPMMMHGTRQGPQGESVHKLLSDVAAATSRVDLSRQQNTFHSSSPVHWKKAMFTDREFII